MLLVVIITYIVAPVNHIVHVYMDQSRILSWKGRHYQPGEYLGKVPCGTGPIEYVIELYLTDQAQPLYLFNGEAYAFAARNRHQYQEHIICKS